MHILEITLMENWGYDMKTNPVQALFGMLWGVWFSTLTRDIIISPVPLGGDVKAFHTIKIIYVVISPIYLAVFVYLLITAQKAMYKYDKVLSKNTTFVDGLKETGYLLLKIVICFGSLWGFLFTTYSVFNSSVDFLFILFGCWQPFIWLVLELIIYLREVAPNYLAGNL